MAELTTDISTCCTPEDQTACCEPAEKSACCGTAASGGSCGCAGGRLRVGDHARTSASSCATGTPRLHAA